MNQTYENLEIICVDDKSPDNCLEILRGAAEKDTRIKVVRHEKNMGIGAAVNSGLERAAGDYVGFADPDDWVEPDFFEKAVELAEYFKADVTATSFYREYPHGGEKMENAKPIPETFTDRGDAFIYGFEADVYKGFKMYLWNKLFASKFFASKGKCGFGLRMDTNIWTGGDSLLATECFLRAERFSYSPQAFYHYRIRENSIMRSLDFNKRLGFEEVLERIVSMLEKEQAYGEAVLLAKRFHTYYCSQLAEFAYKTGDRENLEFSQRLAGKYLGEYMLANSAYPERIERIKNIMSLKLQPQPQ
jgi:glycosyltransferase involved in cell wall biosynthesis